MVVLVDIFYLSVYLSVLPQDFSPFTTGTPLHLSSFNLYTSHLVNDARRKAERGAGEREGKAWRGKVLNIRISESRTRGNRG